MFVESFTLNKNSWHAKLMKLIWGYKPSDFTHMCPYFWLTIFNILIFIPWVVVIGGLLKVISYPIIKFSKFLEDREDKRNAYIALDLLNDSDIDNKLAKYSKYKLKKVAKAIDKYWNSSLYKSDRHHIHNYWDLQEKITILRRTYISQESQREAKDCIKKREVYINAKQSINKTLRFIKPLSTILMYIIGLFIGFYLLEFLWWLIRLSTHIRISLDAFINFIVFGSITGLLTIVIYHLFFKLLPNLFERIETRHFNWLFNFFVWIGMGMALIWNIVVQILHNNCPAIDWKEK